MSIDKEKRTDWLGFFKILWGTADDVIITEDGELEKIELDPEIKKEFARSSSVLSGLENKYRWDINTNPIKGRTGKGKAVVEKVKVSNKRGKAKTQISEPEVDKDKERAD